MLDKTRKMTILPVKLLKLSVLLEKRDDNVKGFVLCNKSKEKDTMVEYNCE